MAHIHFAKVVPSSMYDEPNLFLALSSNTNVEMELDLALDEEMTPCLMRCTTRSV
jgi:hypothetical protein